MTTKVREGSRFGACTVLGELICETTTRYVYRRTRGDETFSFQKLSLDSSAAMQSVRGLSRAPQGSVTVTKTKIPPDARSPGGGIEPARRSFQTTWAVMPHWFGNAPTVGIPTAREPE
jgi:hypothetical protein